MNNAKAELLLDLKQYAYQTGEIALASGAMSNWYVDTSQVLLRGNKFETYKTALRKVADELPEFTAVGGLTMGADPLAFLIASACAARAFSLRKSVKNHGAEADRIVGPLYTNDQILVVDDVTTSGDSLQQTLDVLDEYQITGALCLVDRSEEVAPGIFAKKGIPYQAVFSARDFF